MTVMTIARLAAEGSVGVETVRYYQRRGLMPEPERPSTNGRVRRYGAEDVRRLRFIKTAQAAGFTLEEIGQLLSLDASEDRARARELACARVAALDERIRDLQAARDALNRLAQVCEEGSTRLCPILTAFEP